MDERRVIIESIREFLDARGGCYRLTEDDDIEAEFRGKTARFQVRLGAGVRFVPGQTPALMLSVVVDLPFIVPSDRRSQVAEAVVRANAVGRLSRLSLDMSNGSMCCITFLPVCDGELTQQQFIALFDNTLRLADRYFRAFARLLYGDDLSPAEVIAEVDMVK